MFKLFNKRKSAEPTTAEVIAQIHNEFDSAGEKLLQEAKAIAEAPTNAEKGERLQRLGFNKSLPAEQLQKDRQARAQSGYIINRISYFAQWYPNHKFITEEVVQQICKKYGLLCGPADRYKGDVPEKNIQEMEKFVLREEDKEKQSNGLISGWVDMREFELTWDMPSALIESFDGRTQVIRRSRPAASFSTNAEFEKVNPGFKICAPEKDFDTRGMIVDGYKLEMHIPDPVVLQPVSGGYLIVTKWGLEASDELLVNEKEN